VRWRRRLVMNLFRKKQKVDAIALEGGNKLFVET